MPETITEYIEKLLRKLHGWVFESHRMKPGIGELKGTEFKQNLIKVLEFLRIYKENKSEKGLNTAILFSRFILQRMK